MRKQENRVWIFFSLFLKHATLLLYGFLVGDPFVFASGRNQIIAEFKSLLSSFPEEMGAMQSQLSEYKESASDIHSLRADVQSISNVLDRKVGVLLHVNCTFWQHKIRGSEMFLFHNNR